MAGRRPSAHCHTPSNPPHTHRPHCQVPLPPATLLPYPAATRMGMRCLCCKQEPCRPFWQASTAPTIPRWVASCQSRILFLTSTFSPALFHPFQCLPLFCFAFLFLPLLPILHPAVSGCLCPHPPHHPPAVAAAAPLTLTRSFTPFLTLLLALARFSFYPPPARVLPAPAAASACLHQHHHHRGKPAVPSRSCHAVVLHSVP